MNRRHLLKSLFTSVALLLTPKVKAEVPAQKTYTFNQLFTNRVFKNNNMFFLKKSVFKEKLYKDIGHLISTTGRWYYLGEYDVCLPVKATYTEEELKEFFIIVTHRLTKYGLLLQQGKGQPIYFMRDPAHHARPRQLVLNLIGDFKKPE